MLFTLGVNQVLCLIGGKICFSCSSSSTFFPLRLSTRSRQASTSNGTPALICLLIASAKSCSSLSADSGYFSFTICLYNFSVTWTSCLQYVSISSEYSEKSLNSILLSARRQPQALSDALPLIFVGTFGYCSMSRS